MPFSDKGHLPSQGMEKINYVRRQMMAELGLSQWRSREFWGMVIMFILIFFMRMYLHYVGQWLFLQGQIIPITKYVDVIRVLGDIKGDKMNCTITSHFHSNVGFTCLFKHIYYRFNFLPYTVDLLYQPTLLDTVQEAFVVLIGPFINISFFILLVILSWIMQLVNLNRILFCSIRTLKRSVGFLREGIL